MEKKTLKNRIEEAASDIVSVFKNKPVTMAMIMLIALMFALEIDYASNDELWERIMQIIYYLLPFCVTYAFHSLFIEEVIEERPKKYIAFGYALLISVFVSYTANYTNDIIFGVDKELFNEYEYMILGVYFCVLFIYSIYHMYKASEQKFECYCIDTFCALVRSTTVYVLFAGGTAIIIWIFNELIFSTDSLIGRVEIFLLAGLYVPSIILALSGKKERYGRFAKMVLLYVLEPMMLLTYLIIYIYIFKIFITKDMPSNSVFPILAFVFAAAMPVWTMEHGIEGDSIFLKIAKIVPFIYIPFIFLQIFCVGIRIAEYGITDKRYMAIALVIFEIVYMILYIIQFVKKQAYTDYIFHVLAILIILAVWVPGINFIDVVIASQSARIRQDLIIESPSDEQKYALYDAYHECISLGDIAENRFKKGFSDEELKVLKSYEEYRWYGYELEKFRKHYEYRNAYRNFDSLDISNFKSIQYVYFNNDGKLDCSSLQNNVPFEMGRNRYGNKETEIVELDIAPIVEFIERYNSSECDEAFDDMKLVEVGNGKWMYVLDYSVKYYSNERKFEDIRINGYLLDTN